MGLNITWLVSLGKEEMRTQGLIEGRVCEDREMTNYMPRREVSKKPMLLTPWSGTSSLQKWEKINLCYLSPAPQPSPCYFVVAAQRNSCRILRPSLRTRPPHPPMQKKTWVAIRAGVTKFKPYNFHVWLLSTQSSNMKVQEFETQI